MKHTIYFLSATIALASCAHLIGPDHPVPEMALPDRWSSDGASGKKPLSTPWWSVFGDAELNRLQHLALNANQDLVAAMHRIEEAEAALRIQQSVTTTDPIFYAGSRFPISRGQYPELCTRPMGQGPPQH
jgi:hypothetical protein